MIVNESQESGAKDRLTVLAKHLNCHASVSVETIPVQSETYTHVLLNLLNRNQKYSAQNPFSEDYYLCQYSGV